MIEELDNKDYFYKDSKTINEYFIAREKTMDELVKEEILKRSILLFYNKVYKEKKKELNIDMFDQDIHSYGYIDNYGYYIIKYDSFGYYIIHNFNEDLSSIIFLLIQNILTKKRMNDLYHDKKNIKKEFYKHYDMKYFDIIYPTKYDIDKWNIYFNGNIPKEIIDKYDNYMNIGLDEKVMEYNPNSKDIVMKTKKRR